RAAKTCNLIIAAVGRESAAEKCRLFERARFRPVVGRARPRMKGRVASCPTAFHAGAATHPAPAARRPYLYLSLGRTLAVGRIFNPSEKQCCCERSPRVVAGRRTRDH